MTEILNSQDHDVVRNNVEKIGKIADNETGPKNSTTWKRWGALRQCASSQEAMRVPKQGWRSEGPNRET